jgi:hypothetical protein
MFQTAVTATIAAGSVLLFAYWFRYTCLLIVSAKTALDYAGGVAVANQLSFLTVQSSLHERNFTDLDPLRAALERDYSVVTYLLKNAAHSSVEESSIETRMLAMNYRLMGVWYQFSRRFSTEMACKALEDMSLVVAHFANVMGERNASLSASAA